MANPEGNRLFRPDRHSKAAYQAKAAEAEGGVRKFVRKLNEASVNLPGSKPDLKAHQHIALESQALEEDVADTDGLTFEPTDEKPEDVLIDNSIFAQYSQKRQLLRRDVALREEIDKREQPDPELEFDPDHVSGFIEEEVPLEMLQGKVASRTRYDKELAGDHTNDQND